MGNIIPLTHCRASRKILFRSQACRKHDARYVFFVVVQRRTLQLTANSPAHLAAMSAVSRHSSTARQSDMQTQTPPVKHKRFASLLRLPSSSYKKDKDKETPPASSPRSRRATTNPTTPTPTAPAQNAPSVSPSYFSPQPGSSGSGTDLRSPGSKRPPASFSGHG